MRNSRFTEAQIIGMIKEQEAGLPTVEVCRKHGLSTATFYKLMPAGSWPSGVRITTMSGPTRPWEIGRLHKRVERSSRTKPSHPTRLCRRRAHRI